MERRIQFELSDYLRLEMLGLINSTSKEVCTFHRHPFWELIFSVSGEGVHRIWDREIILREGQMCLVPPDTDHASENRSMNENVKLYIGFSFSTSFIPDSCVECVAAGECVNGEILEYDLFSLAENLENSTKPMDRLQTQLLISALSCLATKLQTDDSKHLNLRRVRRQAITEKIIDYLRHNISRTVRVEELASMFYLSPYYLSEQFRKATGISIKQYHENLRMYHALQRIKEGKHTITEVAEELGYDNIHYFSRRFKLHFGYPPSRIPKNAELVQTEF